VRGTRLRAECGADERGADALPERRRVDDEPMEVEAEPMISASTRYARRWSSSSSDAVAASKRSRRPSSTCVNVPIARDDFRARGETNLQRHTIERSKEMRKLIVSTFVTLDGVMQAPGGPEEDPTEGFGHGGWSTGYWDEAMMERMGEVMGTPFDLLLGRKTYEIFAAHWPYATDQPGADELNNATKYVASTTLDEVSWSNSNLIEGDVPEQVARLKEEDGPEIQVHGSWNLIQTLLEHDLVDEFRLMIFPVVLGGGKRLFGDGTIPAGLRLADSTTSSTGVVMATYERAGDVQYGSFALEEPTEAEVERRRRLADD